MPALIIGHLPLASPSFEHSSLSDATRSAIWWLLHLSSSTVACYTRQPLLQWDCSIAREPVHWTDLLAQIFVGAQTGCTQVLVHTTSHEAIYWV